MSLALAAQHLASTGRNNDTELVHMSKPEVAGLQALAQQHGKQLTRNPSTGLLEAGVLDSILPAVAGAGLSLAFPELSPLMTAGIVGGGTALMSGGNLQKGLMAGLGAYGGAGLANGLIDSGTATLGNGISASPTAIPTAPATSTGFGGVGTDASIMENPNIASRATGFGGVGMDPSVMRTPALNAIASETTPQAIQAAAIQNAASSAPTAAAQQVMEQAQNPTRFAAMSQGFKNLGQTGGLSNLNTLMNGADGKYMGLKYLGAAAAPALLDMSTSDLNAHTAASDAANTIRPYKFSQYHDPNAPINSRTPYFTQTMTALPTYVAPYAGGGMAHGPARGESLRGTMGMLHGTERLMSYAQGGLSNLGSYSDGGQLLRGPGDGVSDDIPAQIGQHQPARLAEGEFVVPARIVSELGNGSTNAGAKRLYDMMNRIQAGRAKTMGGKSAYAKDTNAEQHLPA